MISLLHALVDLDGPDADSVSEAVGHWLFSGLDCLAPNAWTWLSVHATEDVPAGPTARCGPPDGFWGSIAVRDAATPERFDARSLTPDSLARLRADLGARPLNINVSIHRLDRQGRIDRKRGRLHLYADWRDDEQNPVQLRALDTLDDEAVDAPLDAAADRLAEHVRRTSARAAASFGHVCDDAGPLGMTVLDEVIPRGGLERSIEDARRVLRGYSWVTVVPAELLADLGGLPLLRHTGAFHTVEALPSGAVYLRATDRFSAYGEAEIERVFHALAPVLPAGEPEETPAGLIEGRRRRIVWRDASTALD